MMNEHYSFYVASMQKLADVNAALALMQWDQEVYMPGEGAGSRASQIATLSGMAHELGVDKKLGQALNMLSNDHSLDEKEQRNVKESLRNYNDRNRYTKDFVMEMSQSVSEAFQLWQKAKKDNRFEIFKPGLQKLVELKLKECDMLGYVDHPYDALLNQYEPGMTTAQLKVLFADVRKQLVPFVREIFLRSPVNDEFTRLHYPKQEQWNFGIELLKQMGFDFNAGRQDISSHPFTTNFNAKDVRVTTRINENDLCEMIWSCIHEGGHALYEQGLPYTDYGLPSGEYLSLGIHESQSRLWENNVGRSREYWEYNYPHLQKIFPAQLNTISPDHFYKAINKVQPSFIRTSADELTYHFHIMIRFEIETGLMEGKINVADLPGVWNAKYREYLNIEVPDDAHGVLQDVHWSHGSFGYFPTYSLGSFFAAQFYHQAVKEIPGLKNEIASGNMQSLLNWLRTSIHRHGRQFTANELCRKITGEELNFSYFMNYASEKFKA